jgi:hypothetical protein
MRASSSRSKTQILPAQTTQRIETAAVYAALALIAAIVFGTLSVHPF